jgi:hypothetical protein
MCKLLKAKEAKDSSENWPISNIFGNSDRTWLKIKGFEK